VGLQPELALVVQRLQLLEEQQVGRVHLAQLLEEQPEQQVVQHWPELSFDQQANY
jgi:hypothetical protein